MNARPSPTVAATVVAAAVLLAALFPWRTAFVLSIAVAAAAFALPRWRARRRVADRQRRLASDLPDMLDLLATGAEAGRSLDDVLADISRASDTPLARSFGRLIAAIEAGHPATEAWRELQIELGPAGGFVHAVESSRRHGLPLAERLREHADRLRADARIGITDRASRAAPKIQLVVALVLVPSVMLFVVAAVVANAGRIVPL